MTHCCPDCGKNLRAHVNGGACGLVRRAGFDNARAGSSGGRSK
ncbi:MAG: hypothetical protein WDA16_13795 [Candidatus Thermoplasmatota archaeon]